ncbi:L-fuconolactonase [Sphingomonas jinjuensis]|uniref:L-fuconolactonase n=1 Tax=Sphingomonas jinjuensis TaxID=535907 RepID=A0A840FHX8_9SPHN|nr:amidohydrolase family protein [Sphingomonas jinjuensis]MBB4153558.1 L-fuconolactonase [Sphingomonas jinjuensis]
MLDVIDSHFHLWSLTNPGHQWPTPDMPALYRDFTADDLRRAAADVRLAGGVLVQSQPTDADTDWMLAVAATEPLVLGVCGWVDLAAADVPRRIAELAAMPKLRALRPMLQSIADTEWLLRDALAPAIAAMIEHGLRLDALVQPRHLPMLAEFVDRWPALPVVIDHAAKPRAATREMDPWCDDIAALAARGVYCKLSGLRTEQGPYQPARALKPYIDHLVIEFDQRLMWGSDWPVLLQSGDRYDRWLDDAIWLTDLAECAQARLFAGCAREFYDLPPSS